MSDLKVELLIALPWSRQVREARALVRFCGTKALRALAFAPDAFTGERAETDVATLQAALAALQGAASI
jgi:hypothetical protein